MLNDGNDVVALLNECLYLFTVSSIYVKLYASAERYKKLFSPNCTWQHDPAKIHIMAAFVYIAVQSKKLSN